MSNPLDNLRARLHLGLPRAKGAKSPWVPLGLPLGVPGALKGRLLARLFGPNAKKRWKSQKMKHFGVQRSDLGWILHAFWFHFPQQNDEKAMQKSVLEKS